MIAVKGPPLMTLAEVSYLFRVDPKTVTRWAQAGKLASVRTPGNTRRYFRAEVEAIANSKPLTPAEADALRQQYADGTL